MRRCVGRIKSEQRQKGQPWRGGWAQAESGHDCISSASWRSLVQVLLGEANGPVRLSDQRVSWFGCRREGLRVSLVDTKPCTGIDGILDILVVVTCWGQGAAATKSATWRRKKEKKKKKDKKTKITRSRRIQAGARPSADQTNTRREASREKQNAKHSRSHDAKSQKRSFSLLGSQACGGLGLERAPLLVSRSWHCWAVWNE